MNDSTPTATAARPPMFPNALGMLMDFGDAAGEYAAALETAVLFDLSQRTQLTVTGADRVKFLNNFCTNDLMKLTEGMGCEAYLTNVKGRVLADVFVAVESENLRIDAEPLAAEIILPHLERYIITEDVTLTDETAETAKLFVTGPQAAAMLATILNATDIDQLETYQHCHHSFNQIDMSIWRVDWFHNAGYLLSIGQKSAVDIKQMLMSNGAASAGFSAYEALRISSGRPCCGIDFSEENLPQELLGHQQAVSFTKGCYLGQEPIARLDAMGHTNKQLVVLELTLPDAILQTAPLAFQIESHEQMHVGHITSIAQVPCDATTYAFGFIKRGFEQAGTKLIVRTSSSENNQINNTAKLQAVVLES